MWYLNEYNPIQAGSIEGKDVEAHDAGIKRATESIYRPPKGLKTDPLCTLFVGRLSYETTELALENHFKKHGHIVNISIIRNQVTGLSQGYAFVTFESERETRDAYDKANKTMLDHHEILVEYERSRNMKNWIPRRLGGGFGGKKESGQLRFGGRDRPFRPISTTHTSIPYELRKSDNWIHSQQRSRSPHESSSKRRRYRSPSPRRHSSRHHYSSEHRHDLSNRHRRSSPDRHYSRRSSPSNRYRRRSPSSSQDRRSRYE